jgi:hypothetical protein
MTRPVKRAWTQNEIRRLELLAARKVSCEQIAKELDRSPASVKLKPIG